ncbi:NAD(P)/FAD-dependent oxidoreductase [Pseudoruegeria sp. SK021]|uniref:NAD(P)/FAD-dependent oxidoreductase n=1 Tax=Pseudoruegeria sp. SK021 TaxID=1933035 RepID=UPI000A21FE6E|nr:NAD(P)/FAD-dependent oxidoreductase [Pseudoruegeria sp. SK021]OSP56412.1 hypothetical protein BV911_00100 [Pseudoruegeria sp. SK021]
MSEKVDHVPVLIIGAGAAGMMCAAHCGPGAVVIEHSRTPGEKIRISGGGRCNFTNLNAGHGNFISSNPHFAKSALSRYTQWDFIALVDRHGIAWHEKTLGQLFCDHSAQDIIDLLIAEMDSAGAEMWLNTRLELLEREGDGFVATLSRAGQEFHVSADRVVVACGGKSIPKIGASGRGYEVAQDFGLPVTDTRPGLVPLTFSDSFADLAGVACDARIACNGTAFDEALLFTHRGLSGPAILQISSYWREQDEITVTLRPEIDLMAELRAARAKAGRRDVGTALAEILPKRLASQMGALSGVTGRLADLSDARLATLVEQITQWRLVPSGTEGYRKAEVTLGGVDTAALSSRTMEANAVPGLYFIGEVVDVTGWLGGYNFQWAWSSGWAAGTAIAAARAAGQ